MTYGIRRWRFRPRWSGQRRTLFRLSAPLSRLNQKHHCPPRTRDTLHPLRSSCAAFLFQLTLPPRTRAPWRSLHTETSASRPFLSEQRGTWRDHELRAQQEEFRKHIHGASLFSFFAVLEPRRKVSWEERRASAIQGRREDFGRVSTSSSEESRRGSYQSRRRATNQELSQPPGTLFLSRPPRGPLVPPYVVKEDPMNESCLQVMKLVVRPRGGAARIFTGATYLQRSRNRCHLTQLEKKRVFFLDKTLKTHELKKRRGLKAIPFMNDFSWLFRKVWHLLSPFCIIMD